MSRILPEAVPAAAELPLETEVVVIGGGIVGVMTALHLAEAGIPVLLCEKGLIGAEQSGRNWGWVRQMGRDPAEIPLAVESLRQWRGMNARTGSETGFRTTGITYVARSEKQMREYLTHHAHAQEAGVEAHLLDAAAVRALLPGVTGDFVGGLHTPSDGRAEPLMATPAMARAAAAKGAVIRTGCAVRGIETEAGRVSAVITEQGRVRARQVVLAGGAWSRLFAGSLGIDMPCQKVLGSVARLSPVSGVPDMPVGGPDFAFRRRLDGGFSVAMRNANLVPIVPDSFRQLPLYGPKLAENWHELRLRLTGQFFVEAGTPRKWPTDEIGPFEQTRIYDPAPTMAFIRQGIERLVAAFPAFRDARITQAWGGYIDGTPDAVPVIGPVESLPGFFIAAGFSGHGFGIGPGAGRLMAEMLQGLPTHVDPGLFRLDRFRRRPAAPVQEPAAA